MTRVRFYSDTQWVNFVALVERTAPPSMVFDNAKLIVSTDDSDVIESALGEGGVLLLPTR